MFLPKVYYCLVQTPSNLLGQALVPWNSFSALQRTHSFVEGKVCPPTWNKKLLASQKWSITLAYYLGSYSPHKKAASHQLQTYLYVSIWRFLDHLFWKNVITLLFPWAFEKQKSGFYKGIFAMSTFSPCKLQVSCRKLCYNYYNWLHLVKWCSFGKAAAFLFFNWLYGLCPF